MDDSVFDVDTFDSRWASLGDGFANDIKVFSDLFLGKADSSDADVKIAIFIDTVSDFTFLDFSDRIGDIWRDCSSLWVWH